MPVPTPRFWQRQSIWPPRFYLAITGDGARALGTSSGNIALQNTVTGCAILIGGDLPDQTRILSVRKNGKRRNR